MSWKLIMLIAAIVLIVLIVTIAIQNKKQEERRKAAQRRKRRQVNSSAVARRTSHHNYDHVQKQRELISRLPKSEQQDYSHLHASLNSLEDLIDSYRKDLNNEQKAADEAIQRKIDQTKNTIESHWREQAQRKRFYECITLHYASFTLADSIHVQCDKIGQMYSSLKDLNGNLGRQIDTLNRQINNRNSNNRGNLMQQHKTLCDKRHRVSQLQKIYRNNLNDYSERLSHQNQITATYRDFIGNNFGERGRMWITKLEIRKAARQVN